MKIEMELWHLITLLLAFFSCVGMFGKVLLDQVEKRQEERAKAEADARDQVEKRQLERAKAQDKAREEGQTALRETLNDHLNDERRNAVALQSLERDFLKWQAELPIHYVRREDYVRGQSVIEAKLDALYSKLEVVQLKGVKNA